MVYITWKHKIPKTFDICVLYIAIQFIKFLYKSAYLPTSMPLHMTIKKLWAEMYNLLPDAKWNESSFIFYY
jgi:hypothetical protein